MLLYFERLKGSSVGVPEENARDAKQGGADQPCLVGLLPHPHLGIRGLCGNESLAFTSRTGSRPSF